MRRNYFIKLIKYIKNVYNIEHEINKLTDKRVNPIYKTRQVIMPVLFGFVIRIKSLNELKCMLKENEFKNLFSKNAKLPLIDTIRDTLKVIDLNGLANINKSIIKKASNLFQLFKLRRIKNHVPIQKELVRLLLKGLYLLKYDKNIIFDTT